jgi:hypothetical protein
MVLTVFAGIVKFERALIMLAPPTEGYFVIRNRNGWHRIIINNPPEGTGYVRLIFTWPSQRANSMDRN